MDERLGTVVLQEAGRQGMNRKDTEETEKYNRGNPGHCLYEVPVLRESMTVMHLCSLSHCLCGRYRENREVRQDASIRILAEGASLADMDALEAMYWNCLAISMGLGLKTVSRKITNDYMIFGYQLILGGLCSILALIGIANVSIPCASCARRREFARYMSIGMTPSNTQAVLHRSIGDCRTPVLITLPIAVAVMGYMIKASYLDQWNSWLKHQSYQSLFSVCPSLVLLHWPIIGGERCCGAICPMPCGMIRWSDFRFHVLGFYGIVTGAVDLSSFTHMPMNNKIQK